MRVDTMARVVGGVAPVGDTAVGNPVATAGTPVDTGPGSPFSPTGEFTPEAVAFLARLNAWRALSHEEQMAAFAAPAPPPDPQGRVRVGILCPCLYMGGAEAWGLALARSTDPARVVWEGCCVIKGEPSIDPGMRAKTEELMPVTSGHVAARQLAERCDVLVVWAVDGIPNLLRNMERPPAVVSVCHSPVESPWGVARNAEAAGIDRWVAVSELAVPAIPAASRETVPTSVIWNCVDESRMAIHRPREAMHAAWGIPPGAKVAGFLGRLSAEKDPHAMRRMVDHLPPGWRCVLVGAGAENIAPHERLHCVGNDPAAGDVLNAFDVLVVPSIYESFCLTLGEGLWCGVPVVSTDVGIAKLHPGLTHPIPFDADGPTLAAAVLAAHADGPREGSRAWAREKLAPGRFGDEWTDLITSTAPRCPAPGPHLADCGDDVWVGDGVGCDEGSAGFPNVIHIWRGDPAGWGVCRHVIDGKPGGLTLTWREEQLIGKMSPDFDRVMTYAVRPGPLLVHCAAGVTRSTAVALAAKIARGRDPKAAEADIRAAMKRDRDKEVDWNEEAVAEIVAKAPPADVARDGSRKWSLSTPTAAQIDARLAVLRGRCPSATRLPGCGCSGLVGCAEGKGTGDNPAEASWADCRGCLVGRVDAGQGGG